MKKESDAIFIDELYDFLKDFRLNDALWLLEFLFKKNEDWESQNAVVELKESYNMLLDYMARGFNDPDRNKMLTQFNLQAFDLADVVQRNFLIKSNKSQYASTWNVLQKMGQGVSLPELLKLGGSYRQLFDVAWTAPKWTQADYEAAHSIMESSEWAVYARSVLISGVTLSALQIFDILRFRFLLDLSVSPEPVFRVRALVGMVLVYITHYDRCKMQPNVMAQFKLMFDIPSFVSLLAFLQMQLFMTLETKDIEKHITEEIMPKMMKKADQLGLNKNLGLSRLLGDTSEEDLNPEWMEDVQSEFSKLAKQYFNMEKKGADIYLGSFKMLKQAFPFFNVVANWFCPFTTEHPEIKDFAKTMGIFNNFLSVGGLCDSDKYSFLVMVKEASATQPNGMPEQFQKAFGEMVELGKFQTKISDDLLLRSYVQDLYRFFTISRFGKEFSNPFKLNLMLMDYDLLDKAFSNKDIIRQFADFTFGEKSYSFALNFYERLEPTAEIYQKMGFCHQSLENYQEAISVYEKANLMKADSVWTLRQLGTCYRAVDDFAKATAVYEELENFEPENISILLRLSECYLHDEKYDKAFEKLYKADYLDGESGMALRALAWCSLLTDKIDQSVHYYEKILAGSPDSEDYFNAGHAAWLNNDIVHAVEYYRKVISMGKVSIIYEDFFGDDQKILMEKGKTSIDFRLMWEILQKNM